MILRTIPGPKSRGLYLPPPPGFTSVNCIYRNHLQTFVHAYLSWAGSPGPMHVLPILVLLVLLLAKYANRLRTVRIVQLCAKSKLLQWKWRQVLSHNDLKNERVCLNTKVQCLKGLLRTADPNKLDTAGSAAAPPIQPRSQSLPRSHYTLKT